MATSIKLPPELKARIAAVVKGTGKTPHAFMLEAIERQTTEQEKRKRFVAEALLAERETLESGEGFDASEVHAYLEARLKNPKAPRPRPKSWRK